MPVAMPDRLRRAPMITLERFATMVLLMVPPVMNWVVDLVNTDVVLFGTATRPRVPAYSQRTATPPALPQTADKRATQLFKVRCTVNLRNVAVVSALFGLTATITAQQAFPNKVPSKTHARSVTITGCVAQGIDADHYVLANAVRREQPPSSTVTGTSNSTRKTSETSTTSARATERKPLPMFNVVSVKMISATCS